MEIAVDGVVSAMSEHVFLGIDADGIASVVKTIGNPAAHLILRGGKTGPNYGVESVATAQGLLKKRGLSSNLLVDCSHANSNKDHKLQASVFNALMDQRVNNSGIVGLMLESNIKEGNQSLGDPSELRIRRFDHGCLHRVGGNRGNHPVRPCADGELGLTPDLIRAFSPDPRVSR